MSLEVTQEIRDVQDDVGGRADDVTQFEIVLRNCHNRTYYPGQFVEGHVVVDVKRSFITRGIMLQFCGRAGLHWTEKQRGAQEKCVGEVQYDADEEYFDIRNSLLEPGLLPVGVHKFQFKFHLDPPLPENYQDNLCQIEYFLRARLKQDTYTIYDLHDRQDILILNPTDLNTVILPDVTLPVHTQRTMTFGCGCCVSPPLVCFLSLPRSGYSPGETIHIQADVDNNSNRTIRNVKFTLYEERGYRTKHKLHKHRDVLNTVTKGPVKPRDTTDWPDIHLTVPRMQVFNVAASKIFGIRHILEMEVLAGKHLIIPIEVTLGSIPLTSVTMNSPAHSRLQPNKRQQEDRENVNDIEGWSRKGSTAQNDNSRQRRRDRHRKIYPTDVIDTNDYDEIIR